MNWLFLRGLVREKRHWASFPQDFEAAFAKTKVTCLDLPGSGTERGRKSPVTVAGITEDIRQRWLAIPAEDRPNYILSISLGSMIALDWCARHPEDFKSLVIINSSAVNLSFPWERLNWAIIGPLLMSATKKDPLLREKGILMLTTHMQKDIPTLAQTWAHFAAHPAQIRRTALAQLQAAIRFSCPPKLKVPGLVLSSLKDRFTSYRCSQALAKHLELPLSVHPEAGHDLPLDDPEWVIEQVRLFIKLL